ncbi:hypothetical protein OESDEN_02038 [Oesophagostomum dentatum]|uniref:7TM GPCR serpentine receptor class x (Srx) domain-containing protein n=1 Tax=Oesophagostomum dentatum TaxID=61180 RepID=A0A0B1TRD6_OESDE|nr:hypothetical protein OESDEN_02038 [Oesophagostomum dentatum]
MTFVSTEDCSFIYRSPIFSFTFNQNETCVFISWYLDVLKDVIIITVIAVVDTVTVLKVRQTAKKAAAQNSKSENDRRLSEISLLKQAVAQGGVFVVELFTYFYLAWTFQNKWPIWALTTVAWNIVHLSDPMIIITFNKEFRRLISNFFKRTLRCICKRLVKIEDASTTANGSTTRTGTQ